MKCYEVQSVVWTEYPRLFNGTALCTSKLSKCQKFHIRGISLERVVGS